MRKFYNLFAQVLQGTTRVASIARDRAYIASVMRRKKSNVLDAPASARVCKKNANKRKKKQKKDGNKLRNEAVQRAMLNRNES
jgi:hypothetical protein